MTDFNEGLAIGAVLLLSAEAILIGAYLLIHLWKEGRIVRNMKHGRRWR